MGHPVGPFEVARFARVSFGDLLAPAYAIVALGMAISMFVVNKSLQARLQRSIYMDDIQVGSTGPEEDLDQLVEETEEALKKGNFFIKSWTKTGDDGPDGGLKYLSYQYHPKNDKISLRFNFNISKKARGIRTSPDFNNLKEFEAQIKSKPLTKRGVAGLLAGILFDPLGLASCYLVNLKIAYRGICRYATNWDEEIRKEENEIILNTMKCLFQCKKVLLPRLAFVPGAKG